MISSLQFSPASTQNTPWAYVFPIKYQNTSIAFGADFRPYVQTGSPRLAKKTTRHARKQFMTVPEMAASMTTEKATHLGVVPKWLQRKLKGVSIPTILSGFDNFTQRASGELGFVDPTQAFHPTERVKLEFKTESGKERSLNLVQLSNGSAGTCWGIETGKKTPRIRAVMKIFNYMGKTVGVNKVLFKPGTSRNPVDVESRGGFASARTGLFFLGQKAADAAHPILMNPALGFLIQEPVVADRRLNKKRHSGPTVQEIVAHNSLDFWRQSKDLLPALSPDGEPIDILVDLEEVTAKKTRKAA